MSDKQMELIGLLNTITSNDWDKETQYQLEALVQQTDPFERHTLYTGLNDSQLEQLYLVAKRGTLNTEFTEHFLYYYYMHCSMDDTHIKQLLEDYNSLKYLSIESALIMLLKYDVISFEHIENSHQLSYSEELEKQIYLQKIRMKLEADTLLQEDEIERLLKLEAYDLIIDIVNKRKLVDSAWVLFHEPLPCEKNKRKKQLLYTIASGILRQKT